jgi:cytochrome d ubiquinol oxidase subunit I
MDPFLLSRIQFATNISVHILFPTISIGLAWFLVFVRWRAQKTGDPKWMKIYHPWVKTFAITFALGIVTGLTMSFQFGTNWPGYMDTVGNIAGPLLAYEVLTAFFLEAAFLGIMLYGEGRVTPRVHMLATILVAFGTTLSAFWILALNSWMQTPAGFEMIDGKAYPTDILAILFNPSMPYREIHTLLASFLTTAFMVAGVSAYRWHQGDRSTEVNTSLKSSVYMAAFLIPLQILAGDFHGLNTLKHQPAKVAAMEGSWEPTQGAPLILFGIPNLESRKNQWQVGIPKFSSLILTHGWEGEVPGLSQFGEDIPPVLPVFFAFRGMVGVGMLMLFISWFAAWRLKRHHEITPFLSKILISSTFLGWVGVLCGWYVTEIGRQPFLVYGVLRTKDALAKIPNPMVFSTLILYLVLYAVMLITYIIMVFRIARKAIPTPYLSEAESDVKGHS